MFQSESLLGARTSANMTASSNGVLLDPNGLIVSSATGSTSFGAAESTAATGVVGTAQSFRTMFSTAWGPNAATRSWNGRAIVRVPWTLTTGDAAGGSASEGTMRATLAVNGVTVATAQGAARNVHTSNGTQYVELIELDMTSGVQISPGQPVTLTIQPIITTASGVGGSTMVTTLRHDPQVIADQLVIEFTGSAQQ